MIPFQTFIVLITLAMPVFADSDLSILNLPKAGTTEFFFVFGSLFICLSAVIVGGIYSLRKQKKQEVDVFKQRFISNCRRFTLDKAEEAKLTSMIAPFQVIDPNDVFDAPQLYEQCIDKEVNDIIKSGKLEQYQPIEDLLTSIRNKLHYRLIDDGAPLSSTRNIPNGQRLSLVMHRCEAVMGVNREFSFTLKVDNKDSVPLIAPRSNLRLVFSRRNDALYGVEVVVINSDPSGFIRCRHTVDLKRNQLRRDVRLGVSSSIKLRVNRPADPSAPSDTNIFLARMVDISGGGISFVAEKEMVAGDLVNLISAGPQIPAAGILFRILAISSPPNKDQGKRYHAQFINIGFDKREKLIRYIFEKMRELNRR